MHVSHAKCVSPFAVALTPSSWSGGAEMVLLHLGYGSSHSSVTRPGPLCVCEVGVTCPVVVTELNCTFLKTNFCTKISQWIWKELHGNGSSLTLLTNLYSTFTEWESESQEALWPVTCEWSALCTVRQTKAFCIGLVHISSLSAPTFSGGPVR